MAAHKRNTRGLKPFKKGVSGNPSGRPPDILTRAMKQLTRIQLRELAGVIVTGTFEDLERVAKNKKFHALQVLVANALLGAYTRKEFYTVNMILEQLIGKVPTGEDSLPIPTAAVAAGKKTFEEFCQTAGYPAPYPKQMEMYHFGMHETVARLLLGSRGYGKTDYVVIMGLAYELYCDSKATTLILTKSKERNAAMLSEIAEACKKNGVTFDKENSTCLRVTGLIGKDHSISAATIGGKSLRGRHPKRVVMDDPVTEEDASEATRKLVQRVYNEASKLCSNVLIIGQPVHKLDLYGKLRPLVKKMEVPHGTIPELDHDLEAQRLAGVSEESIQSSYFLKAISENAAPLEDVNFISEFPVGDSVAFIDPSHEGGDFTALSIITGYFDGVAVKGRVFKKAWNHCLDEMAAEMQACGVKRICFETNALGDMPVQMLRDVMPEGVGVVGRKSTNNKHSRIMAAGPFAKRIHIVKSSDRIYIDQVTQYEYGAKNDDAPDSLATGLEWIGLIRGKQKA